MQGSSSRAQVILIRSSDGNSFFLPLQDLHLITTLNQFKFELVSPLLEIPLECLILMNDKGIPLHRDEDLFKILFTKRRRGGGGGRDSSEPSGEDQEQPQEQKEEEEEEEEEEEMTKKLYVFDRRNLDGDPEELADQVKIFEHQVLDEPPLNPEDPLSSHLHLSIHNLEILKFLTHSIKNQRSSLSLALSNLDRVNQGTVESFKTFNETNSDSFKKFEQLLKSWEENMNSIKKVRVVNGLLVRNTSSSSLSVVNTTTTSQGSTIKGGEEKQRFLGDYVSTEKMVAVRDGCAKVLAELKMKSESLQITLDQVLMNAEAVQADLEATSRDLEDLDACEQDAEHGHLRIEELVHAGESMTDSHLLSQCFEELSVCDAEHRDRIRFLIERKNAMTRYVLHQMQTISELQSDIATMPSDLGLLDHDLRTRTENFKHLARLEGLIPAYIATVAEVIRRKEYGRLLSNRSISLSTMFQPLTELELSRRKLYRSKFSGKLPWEVRGLGTNFDELVPNIGFGIDLRGIESLPSELGRDTLDQLRITFDELVKDLTETNMNTISNSSSSSPELSQHPLVNGRNLLQELIQQIEQLSKDFEKLSHTESNPITIREEEEQESTNSKTRIKALEVQLRQLEESNEQLSRQLQSERSSHEETVSQLESKCLSIEGVQKRERQKLEEIEREKLEVEKKVEGLEKEKERARRDREEEKERRVEKEKELDETRRKVERLERTLREKIDVLDKTTRDIQKLKDRLREREKELGALKSEADLDRAVLEKELEEVRKLLEGKEQDVEHHEGRNRTLEQIAEGLREQIARWETHAQTKEKDFDSIKKELEETRQDKERGIVDIQKELIQAQRQARTAVIIAAKLRDENDNITRALNTPPPPKTTDPSTSTTAATELDKATQSLPPTEPPQSSIPPLDYASCEIDELLQELEQVNHVPLTEAIRNKMDGMTTLTKKWVKEAKAYRERAHRAANGANDKIAFRHFAKGDLALFLPTRNSTVPVWAAFNVSFPHHFLSPTGVIAEQMKTREWIVARITSLSETIVDAKDPSTNPYLLAPGTKFFLLEVEPWSSKESSRARKHSSDKDKDKGKSKSSSTTPSRPTRSSSEAVVSNQAPSSTAESAILVERPISNSSPKIRRTVSEGFPQSSPSVARPNEAITEEYEESAAEPDSLPPSPPSGSNIRQSAPTSLDDNKVSASPSGLARALARSQPPTPSQQKSDPFASASTNPFQISSSPVVGSPLRQAVSPPTTDYDPSHSTTGASPAFLPSASSRRSQATSTSPSLSSSATTQSPRYIRSSPTTRKDSRAVSITGSRPSPSTLLSSSPASSSANSIHASSQPRSASSGSSILSSSMHRRGLSGMSGISPSLIDGKALPTKEAQLNDSRWNLLQDGLVDEPSNHSSSSSSKAVPVVTRGGSGGGESSGKPSSSPGDRRGLISSSASTPSVFDILTGKNRSKTVERKSSTSSLSGAKGKNETAEGEIRKLLGQPQF
ncbi:hypothetical protein JCM3765_000650 [Sporobolomyces pararoseus]